MNKEINIIKRVSKKKNQCNKKLLEIERQQDIIKHLFDEIENKREKTYNESNKINNTFLEENIKTVEREIRNKINGYKQQDIKKKRINYSILITQKTVYKKLINCDFKCYYCKNQIMIIYNNVRQMNQWTLERLDNNKGHNFDNCVISCLKCNLNRRVSNSDNFKFTKQMVIKKMD